MPEEDDISDGADDAEDAVVADVPVAAQVVADQAVVEAAVAEQVAAARDARDDDANRRVDSRQPIELKVEYKRLNSFFADYTKNISRGGTFIKTNRPLPIGTEFVFKLFVPQLERPLAIHGEVQWVVTEAEAEAQRGEPGMGIRFVYRSGDPQAEIAKNVEKLMVDSLGQRLTTKLMEHSRENG